MTTSFAAVTEAPALVAFTDLMYAPRDKVRARSDMYPFWMTVTSVNPRTGFCRCAFGNSGKDAGNFHQSELMLYGDAVIRVEG